ncbi:lactate dehydrogenase [Basidiobolus meristosporus CBS 931.73]|uniref:L-lactate dehydrogenase n=1 Tax=Basidiobolus meristosporus CBS 931.73 TaxID=1314790 RepID=A0A1Y1YPF7_9FUNG|nr:lactate dehydrogenase [Basidiobolus meristosporus CBS 931.73]|eukprot:ORX99858.1 lactate dehydrogenase [Basidiobolus meristosporus CBS 931.73]
MNLLKPRTTKKISIVGSGVVGASSAYALMLRNVAPTVMLCDAQPGFAHGQVMDMIDCQFLTTTKVRTATHKECGQADIIVITAGVNQKPGETRLQLIEQNYHIMKDVIQSMSPIRPDAKILVVANPVDLLTYFAQKLTNLPHNQVFGSGTFLDSLRLRNILANHLGFNPTAIHSYVLGEHGDAQFVAWSCANVGNMPLLSFPQVQRLDLKKIERQAARKAYNIINLKGSTYYGIGACVSSLCESIVNDVGRIQPVSCWSERHGLYLSLPAAIGANGVEWIADIPLNRDEQARLNSTAESMRRILNSFEESAHQDLSVSASG